MNRMQRPQIKIAILVPILALGFAACQAQQGSPTSIETAFLRPISAIEPVQLEPGDKLSVVASTNLVFDTVQRVGGEHVELEALIPRGADPHAYDPSPGDLRALAQADMVFINGIDLEESLHSALSEIADDTIIVSLSEGIPLASFSDPEPSDDGEHDEEEHDEGEHNHSGQDPHVWLDPVNVQAWTQNAAQALAAIDPERADHYQSSADAYAGELEQLHMWAEARLADIPASERKLVTDHRALGYFAARYDFKLVATVIPAYSTVAEPSARELGELIETIEAESVQAIFVGSNVNTTIAERVAEDAGIQVVPLFIGTLGPAQGPASDYIAMMKYNVEAIVAALSQQD